MKKWVLFFVLPLSLLAKIELPEVEKGIEAPWFTGPLLATSATVVPVGHFGIEPYFYAVDNFASYQENWSPRSQIPLWNLIYQVYMWVGLTQWCDLQIAPAWQWSYRGGPARWEIDDLSVKLEFQLYRDTLPHKSWIPSIKFSVLEILPIGNYKNLDPFKRRTDLSGWGSYTTLFQLAFGREFQISGVHWIQARLVLDYQISTPAHVSGFNAYGGGYGAHGTVYPGQQFQFDAALEYTLTRNWALACDFVGTIQGSSRFTGDPGMIEPTIPAVDKTQPSIQYSIAPAIEYNWSDEIGIIAGGWFTVAGKNISRFFTGVVAFNYYH
jgi:hypothetical protein